MCSPKGCDFSVVVLVLNRASILDVNRVSWFLHSSLKLGMFLRTSYLYIIIDKTINKSLS